MYGGYEPMGGSVRLYVGGDSGMVGRGNEAGTEGWHDGGESASLRQETVQLLSYAVVCFGMVAAMVARADGDYPFGGRFAVFSVAAPLGTHRCIPITAEALLGRCGHHRRSVAELGCGIDVHVRARRPLLWRLDHRGGPFLVSPRFGLASAGINVLLVGFHAPGCGGMGRYPVSLPYPLDSPGSLCASCIRRLSGARAVRYGRRAC